MKKVVITLIGILSLGLIVLGSFLYLRSNVSLLELDENETVASVTTETTNGVEDMSYISITMEEAKVVFETQGNYIILDVRREDEFATGHIPGAINIANEDIGTEMPAGLQDKDQIIYVYCRSGNRSKQASNKLVAMGYTNIIEFGGILDWTGEIEK